jgi:hypothetical protein
MLKSAIESINDISVFEELLKKCCNILNNFEIILSEYLVISKNTKINEIIENDFQFKIPSY